jgi:antitoxin ParD1/3/4
MTVTLTAEQEKFIADRMNRREYASPEKILDEGLKLIQAKEEYEQRLAQLRREIDIGLDQIKRGETIDGKKAIEQILEKNRQRIRR